MARTKGQVGSPSLTQPKPWPYKLTPEQVERRRASLVLARQVRAVNRHVPTMEAPADREVSRTPQGHPPLTLPKRVTVTLQMRHSINGTFYGPGMVTLTESKANAFLNTEHEALVKEASLFQQQAFIIGFRNGVPMRREVPAQRFDDILAREELPIDTMGRM